MEQAVQALVSGLLVGSVLALLSGGFSLVWGATGTINISHTAFAVAAAYLAYVLAPWGAGGLVLTLLVGLPLGFAAGVGTYRILVRPAARRVQDLSLVTLVVTFGVSMVLENLLSTRWGPGPRVLHLPVAGEAVSVLGARIPVATLLAALSAWVGLAGLWLFLYRLYPGKAVRAVWQDPLGAALCGIDRDRVTDLAFGVATATAVLGGVAMGMVYAFSPAVHIEWLIWAFLIVIVGGVGSLPGATLAGLLIGLASTAAGLWVAFSWTPLILFGMLMAVILWRPTGLFRF